MSKRTFSLIIVLLSFVFSAAQLSWYKVSANAVEDFSNIDGYITNAMKRYNIPGMSLAIIQGDQISFSKGYGTSGNGRIITADTPFYIGSQSKSFTALAIMQLVEKGKLALDAPVQTYIPWFRVADPQASQQITIRHLLQHTSGLSESSYVADFPPDTDLEFIVRDLSRAQISAPVGDKMQYFNPGYDTLGFLIETISGQSYGDYLQEHIFTPLKMVNSFTDPTSAQTAGLAKGYSQIFMFAVPLNQPYYEFDLPSGFIISTANDMARFIIALNNSGELDGVRVLQRENVELIFTPNTAINSTYGFGWYITKYYGEIQITHGGDTERFHTSVLLLPQSNLSLVLLINENHLIKDYNEYNTIFWGLTSLLTDHPMPQERLSSIFYGMGLFTIWLLFIALAVRKLIKLPQWHARMLTWDSHRRWRDIIQHVFWISFSFLVVTVIAPAFLHRGFSWKWFIGFLPDVAIVVATLVLDDTIQLILKLLMIIRQIMDKNPLKKLEYAMGQYYLGMDSSIPNEKQNVVLKRLFYRPSNRIHTDRR